MSEKHSEIDSGGTYPNFEGGYIDREEEVDFLDRVPPKWEEAEKHGRANLVLDHVKLENKRKEKKYKQCECPCKLIVPTDKHTFAHLICNMAGDFYSLF